MILVSGVVVAVAVSSAPGIDVVVVFAFLSKIIFVVVLFAFFVFRSKITFVAAAVVVYVFVRSTRASTLS